MLVHLWLDPPAGHSRRRDKARHVDLVVEVPYVAHHGLVLHPGHVLDADHPLVARSGDEDIADLENVLQASDLEALHGRLQGTYGVDLGDNYAGTLSADGLCAALAHISIAADDHDLAADHQVQSPVQPVEQRVAAAVEVVELRLGHRVVHVDGGKQQGAVTLALVKAVDAGRGLLRDPADVSRHALPEPAALIPQRPQAFQNRRLFVGRGRRGRRHGALNVIAESAMDHQCGVAAIVEDQARASALGPQQGLGRGPPVLRQSLALPGEDRNAGRLVSGPGGPRHHRRRGMVLSREDVAGRPP